MLKTFALILLSLQINAEISVVGKGTVSGAPDTAKISFKVITKEADAKKAQEKNTLKMNKVIKNIKSKFSIEQSNLQTSQYSLTPRYKYQQNQAPELIGMEVLSELTVRLDDLSKVSELINFLASSEVSEIGTINFQIKDSSLLEKEALRLAFKDAKEKAETLAKQAKLSINTVKSITESTAISGGPMPLRMEKMMASPTIESGDISVSATLNVAFKTD